MKAPSVAVVGRACRLRRSKGEAAWGGGQEERGEQLHSFAFLAGIMASFGMAALLQLTFPQDAVAPAVQTGFAISVALTVPPPSPPPPPPQRAPRLHESLQFQAPVFSS